MSSKATVRDDPRDASLEVPSSPPSGWTQSTDGLGSSTMLLGGLTMVTRNPTIAWATLIVGLWGWLNSHPLRTKEGGTAGSGILFAAGALIAAYVPRLIIQPTPLS